MSGYRLLEQWRFKEVRPATQEEADYAAHLNSHVSKGHADLPSIEVGQPLAVINTKDESVRLFTADEVQSFFKTAHDNNKHNQIPALKNAAKAMGLTLDA